jgi:hypothetical protein
LEILILKFFSFQPPPGAWDHTVDEREHTVEQWKSLIYEEVKIKISIEELLFGYLRSGYWIISAI